LGIGIFTPTIVKGSVGTGLGEAGMYYDGKNYHPFPTEGGHCDFAPTDQEEIDLLNFIRKKYVHVSYERILSGKGFYTLYRFYTEVMNLPKDELVENEYETALFAIQ
jgi:glucokinase